ncbi:uncharacterized protein [Amphiura filiformis]|uniref:uncharacterized protein n=1 Tax=Amphiura filiformis TaxID=82378 RepID=UPI003B222C18
MYIRNCLVWLYRRCRRFQLGGLGTTGLHGNRGIMPRWFRGAALVRFGVVCSVVLIWVTVFNSQLTIDLTGQNHVSRGLNVWLDLKQTKEFTGLDSPIFLVHNGKSSTFLTRSLAADSSLGIARLLLSPNDDVMNISWRAPTRYHYNIEDTFSTQPEIASKPAFSIAPSGFIPASDKAFSVYFHCTGRKTGTSSVGFVLRIKSSVDGQNLETPSSPLRLQFEKECQEDLPKCVPECHNGGVCNVFHQCECPDGYYGPACKQALCDPHCYNGGSCVAPGLCMCPLGFIGDACQTAFCQNNCNQHGHCVGPERCECYKHWQGKYCDKPVTSPLYSRFVKQTKKYYDLNMDRSRTSNNTKNQPKR